MKAGWMLRNLLCGLGLLALGAGCNPSAAAGPGTGDQGAVAAGTPKKEQPHYALEGTPATARAGQPAQAELKLVGRGGYHVNVDYPTRVQLKGSDGVTLAAPTLGKGEATELTTEQARFPVRFTPGKPGTGQVEASISFSVCDASKCEMFTDTLAWPLTVTP